MESRRRRTGLNATGIVLAACTVAALLIVALPRKRRAPADAPEPAGAAIDAQPAHDVAMLLAIEGALSPPADGPAPTVDDLARRVAALGPGALAPVVSILCGEVDPAAVDAENALPTEVHPAAIDLRDRALVASLDRFGRARAVAEIELHARGDAPVEARIAAARLLGEIEHPNAAAALLRLIDGVEPIHLMRAYVGGTLEEALAAQLARDPGSLATLALDSRRRGPAVLAIQARAAGHTPTVAAARFLARIAGRDPALDVVVATELARIGETARIAPPEDALDAVRSMLDDLELDVRRASAVAAGKLRDPEAFFELAQMLASGEALLGAPARAALKAIAGVDLGAEPEAWLAWREAEFEWADAHMPATYERLLADDPGEVAAAMSELTRHPFFRHESAVAIAALADGEDAIVAHCACNALLALRSTRALPWLVAALEVADKERAELLGSTLAALTGLDLPAEADDWRRALAD